ncbi:guided entry of tail-anchored proteins factor 1-like [Oscarella lobularis]|uniref:guided entry of tail-anchored proteins factor 1-like n=1 Tax=Oscarella lobularis TaxID=121494 RepID=UPI00331383E8
MNFHAFLLFAVVFGTETARAISQIAFERLSAWWGSRNEKRRHLQAEVTRLRREKDGINGQERYAEFIKTNRKLTAALEELKNFDGSVSAIKQSWIITLVAYVLSAMVYIFLMFWYRSEVLWNVPTLDLDPMSSIIAFPAGKPGDVSGFFWILCCRQAYASFSSAFSYLWSCIKAEARPGNKDS